MSAVTDFREYLDQTGELPSEILLGRIVMYNVRDEHIKRRDVIAAMSANGLDLSLAPPEIRIVDAYRKATTSLDKMNWKHPDDNTKTTTLLVRELGSTPESVTRNVVREIRQENRRLSYDIVATMTFKRIPQQNTGDLSITLDSSKTGFDQERILSELNRVAELFDTLTECIDGNTIRRLLRNYMTKLNAVELRRGVYFVHEKHADVLPKLAGIPTARISIIPLVNVEDQKEIIEEAFIEETQENLISLITTVKNLKDSGVRTPAAYDRVHSQFQQLIVRAKEHQILLETSKQIDTVSIQTAMDVLMDYAALIQH